MVNISREQIAFGAAGSPGLTALAGGWRKRKRTPNSRHLGSGFAARPGI